MSAKVFKPVNRVIWKYPLEITGKQEIELPYGSQILTVQMQGDTPCIWALVDPANATRRVMIKMSATGQMFDTTRAQDYIGTVQFEGLVWHFFWNQ